MNCPRPLGFVCLITCSRALGENLYVRLKKVAASLSVLGVFAYSF